MVVPSKNQQNELWIFLVVTWWIGSLVAWIAAWTASTSSNANDSLLTASGLLLFGVSVALRLPVITSTQPTTSLEDHFACLVTASANVNWLGYLCLSSQSYVAVLPAAVVGLAVEFWLWNEMCRRDCLVGLRVFVSSINATLMKTSLIAGAHDANKLDSGSNATAKQSSTNSVIESSTSLQLGNEPHLGNETVGESRTIQADLPSHIEAEGLNAKDSTVLRTSEEGIDPAGFRYMAGEIQIAWEDSQRSQTVVLGFVPAFQGSPEVELELDCEECSAQIQNCTPSGLRIQLKRVSGSNLPLTNLSWYAKESNFGEHPDGESAESKPQTLA